MRNDTKHDTKHDATRATAGAGGLARLGELDDYKVADGDPDIRGWEVRTADGRKIGKVEELIAEPATMKVRYMEVKLDEKAGGTRDNEFTLMPIGTARLDEDSDAVVVNRMPTGGFAGSPAYSPDRFTRGHEASLRGKYGKDKEAGSSGDFYGNDLYDDSGFFGKRRKGREQESYLTRSEEELAVGKRKVEAGAVDVRKSVETEHVKKSVPVTREEVTVERRPMSGNAGGRDGAQIGEDEVRIPLMAEEVVVDKRTVPKEELVIKKHAVRDEKTIEADLKKERVEVKSQGDVEQRGR